MNNELALSFKSLHCFGFQITRLYSMWDIRITPNCSCQPVFPKNITLWQLQLCLPDAERSFIQCTRPGVIAHLIITTLLDECLPGLQLALQYAVVSILLVDLLPVRVHLHHQLRVPLLQPAPGRVRPLHLRLHLGQLIQQAAVSAGHCPVVERQYGDDHHQEDEDEGREAASTPVCTKPNHVQKKKKRKKQRESVLHVGAQCANSPSVRHIRLRDMPPCMRHNLSGG